MTTTRIALIRVTPTPGNSTGRYVASRVFTPHMFAGDLAVHAATVRDAVTECARRCRADGTQPSGVVRGKKRWATVNPNARRYRMEAR